MKRAFAALLMFLPLTTAYAACTPDQMAAWLKLRVMFTEMATWKKVGDMIYVEWDPDIDAVSPSEQKVRQISR